MGVVPGSGLSRDDLFDSGAQDSPGEPFEPGLIWRRVLRHSENSVWWGRARRGRGGPEKPLDNVESATEFGGGLGQPERRSPPRTVAGIRQDRVQLLRGER
jgi:hypothetical protein